MSRGSYTAAVDRMALVDSPAYTSNATFQEETVVIFIAARQHRSIVYARPDKACTVRPQWYVSTASSLPGRIELGPASSPTPFEKVATYPASPLSGMDWTLYRQSD